MEVPKLKRVVRLDSLPLGQTYYTPEGYLIDRPILTSTGIFEYHNEDGSVRRELRLPEEVFSPESLKSYKGRPVIITHDAGLVTKDNVHYYQVGTILSDGYRDGDDVRAEIVINDTDEMKRSGLKELSLGYNLDLDETPGVWNGQPYDAVQRNIRINHLALVREARAGDQARLNIDSRDTIKGGKMDMNKKTPKKTPQKARRADGILSPEELAVAIDQYKQRRAKKDCSVGVADADEPTKEVVSTVPENKPAAVADADEPAAAQEPATIEEKVQAVKDRKDRRDQEGDPETVEEAKKTISNQDDDMDMLFDIIDTLLAEKAFDEAKCDEGEKDPAEEATAADEDDPAADKENADEDEDPIPSADETTATDGDEAAEEEAPSKPVKLNADSIDAIVRDRVAILRMGEKLNMDGLDSMSVRAAKCAVIKAVTPSLRLDGKSPAYITALFDRAVADVNARSTKDIGYQKRQMFNNDGRTNTSRADSADAARQRMIERRTNRKETK